MPWVGQDYTPRRTEGDAGGLEAFVGAPRLEDGTA